MKYDLIGLLTFVVAMVTSMATFPWALTFAQKHGIVDNPNARKLQRIPVPVFGGIVVYCGIVAGGLTLGLFVWNMVLLYVFVGMTFIMGIGLWDDIKDISATLRFFIEVVLVFGFIIQSGVLIDDFHGLWGIHEIDDWIAIPLSVIAGVGVINAVNLIDGVDGYSSGYGIMACTCFGLMYWSVWSSIMVCLTLLVIGALLPFFMHNVFGVKSKMYIGDSGTLMLGMIMTICLFYSLSSKQPGDRLEDKGISLVAFTLAVLCIPVFDTLRVMTNRVLRGKSPFKPDKTHLHHLFIDMGFSHLGTAMFILMINLAVVLTWLVLWKMGASINMQMYVVVGLGFLVTFGFYKFMKLQQNGGVTDEEGYPQGTWIWHSMRKVGNWTHREKKKSWRLIRWIMDGPLLFGHPSK